jgi:hypothetical protein
VSSDIRIRLALFLADGRGRRSDLKHQRNDLALASDRPLEPSPHAENDPLKQAILSLRSPLG